MLARSHPLIDFYSQPISVAGFTRAKECVAPSLLSGLKIGGEPADKASLNCPLADFAPMAQLRKLDISGTQVHGSLSQTAQLLQLTCLNCSHTRLSGDVAHLAALNELVELALEECVAVKGCVPHARCCTLAPNVLLRMRIGPRPWLGWRAWPHWWARACICRLAAKSNLWPRAAPSSRSSTCSGAPR